MLLLGDSAKVLKEYPDNHFDLIVTDPPYGISFMGKDWDKALPDKEVWKQCYRVLKEGKLAFVMCSPRQDVLSRMIIALEDAGFRTNYTSIYHTYASGFPKALNIEKHNIKRGKALSKSQMRDLWKTIVRKTECNEEGNDRRIMQSMLESMEQGTQCQIYASRGSEEIQIPERQRQYCMERWTVLSKEKGQLWTCQICKMPIGIHFNGKEGWICYGTQTDNGSVNWESVDKNGMCTSHQSSNIGQSIREFNVICDECTTQKVRESGVSGSYVGVQVKPAVEVILVVSKGKTLTWLDDCRIPYQSEQDKSSVPQSAFNTPNGKTYGFKTGIGRTGELYNANQKGRFPANLLVSDDVLNDGSLHKSGKILPHHKIANSTADTDQHCYGVYNTRSRITHGDSGSYSRYFSLDKWYDTFPFKITPKASKSERGEFNKHPTVKPLKLLSYLITLGSRENDLVLDPFVGSGTSYLACMNLNRNCIGIEMNPEYIEIAKARVKPLLEQTKLV